MYSKTLAEDEMQRLSVYFENYGKCRHMFLNRYCGINSMALIQDARKVRNQVRLENKAKVSEQKFEAIYHFQTKSWVNALMDTCANLKAMWSNLANRLNKLISQNDHLNDTQKHVLWHAVLTYQDLELNAPKSLEKILSNLSPAEKRQAYNYLRRITRRYSHVARKVKNKEYRSISVDYDWKLKNQRIFSFISETPRKPYQIELTSNWCYKTSGDIKIILDRYKKRLIIHKLIKAKTYQHTWEKEIGVDKGLATLLSVDSENEYGKNFSALMRKYVDLLAKRNANRNPYLGLRYQLNKKLNDLSLTAKQQRKLKRQVTNLEQNNIGKRRYNRRAEASKSTIDAFMNQAIRQLIKFEQPRVLVKEDLTFTRDSSPKKEKNRYQRRIRRNLNSWVKGRLNDRLEYLSDKHQVMYVDVNPAYTSQYCPLCGAKLNKRYGNHNQLTSCPSCGKMDANIAAAKNILKRLSDKEITFFTPYKQVKKILDLRASKA